MVSVIGHDKATFTFKEFSDQKAGVRRLLSLPSLQLHVLRAANDPIKSNDQVANLIKYDPTLVARLLDLSSNEDAKKTVQERIAATPRDSIKQLILSGCAERYAMYQSTRKEVFDFLRQQWVLALQTAFLSRSLAYQFNYSKPEQAFFAGLIHNIGQSLFQSEDIDDYFLLQQNANSESELIALEKEQYGFDHTLLGSYLAKQWGLEISIQDAIRYHHTPLEKIQDAHPLTRIVYLARCIAEIPFTSFKELLDFAQQVFIIEHDELIPLIESALSQAGDVIRALNINIPASLLSQTLVPFLPEEQAHYQLQETAKSHQLMREIHICGVIDAVDITLANAGTELELQQQVNSSAKTLYGTTECIFFGHHPESNSLRGNNLAHHDSVCNEICITLTNGHSLLAKAHRANQICDTFKSNYDDLSVIDREIIAHAHSTAIICAPIVSTTLMGNSEPHGILVFGFDTEADFQITSIQASIRYFSQRISYHLDRIKNQQTSISQIQDTEKGLHTAQMRRMVHEINNPLSIAQNNIHVLGIKYQDDEELKAGLLNVQEEITRAAELLKDHLDCAIDPPVQQHPININELASDLLLIFKDGFTSSKDIVCEQELDQSIPPVYIDESALKQILTNLVKNAAESMTTDGWLCLKTFDQVVIGDKNYIEVQVVDDGPGVPKAIIENLFSPVESNKGAGHAGIGLSIVNDLAQSIDGFVSYRRIPGQQTIFSLHIPRLTQPPESFV